MKTHAQSYDKDRLVAYGRERRIKSQHLTRSELEADMLALNPREATVTEALNEVWLARKRRRVKLRLKDPYAGCLAKATWKGGRAKNAHWHAFHRDVFGSRRFKRLKVYQRDLLLYAMTKYTNRQDGSDNNGRISLTLQELRKNWGWGDSPRTLADGIKRLIELGFLRCTREATQHQCAWYALTWL